VREVLHWGWDMLIVAHPPCTRLCNSGVKWLSTPPPGKTLEQMWRELDEGAALFADCWNAPVDRICVENPVMHKHAKARIRNYREFTQSVPPWQFGHGETKRTCLWLKNLPPLTPTNIVSGRENRIHRMPPGENRWRERSRFFKGIAEAMADQWAIRRNPAARRCRQTSNWSCSMLPDRCTPVSIGLLLRRARDKSPPQTVPEICSPAHCERYRALAPVVAVSDPRMSPSCA